MADPRRVILATAPLRGPGLGALQQLGEVVLDPWIDHQPLRLYSSEQLAERARELGASVLICEADSCKGPVLDLPLEAIGSTRGDPTNVDVAGATAKGIPVLRAPGRNADAVAELTVGLLLAATRLSAQELYQLPPGAHSRVSSFENLNGLKGRGGQSNATAKGHAFEDLKAGETKTLLDVTSAGIVQRIWMTISDRSPVMLRSLRLRMYWDANSKPAVDVPLGDFFVAPAGLKTFSHHRVASCGFGLPGEPAAAHHMHHANAFLF